MDLKNAKVLVTGGSLGMVTPQQNLNFKSLIDF
jgi:hypothetical protein